MTNTFQEVSELEFRTYIEDIKKRLLKDAPEWHVNVQTMADPSPRNFYHLARFDFSKGKDQTWCIPLNEFIFGYELFAPWKIGTSNFFLLNLHPLGNKE